MKKSILFLLLCACSAAAFSQTAAPSKTLSYGRLTVSYDPALYKKAAVIPVLNSKSGKITIFLSSEKLKGRDGVAVHKEFVSKFLNDKLTKALKQETKLVADALPWEESAEGFQSDVYSQFTMGGSNAALMRSVVSGDSVFHMLMNSSGATMGVVASGIDILRSATVQPMGTVVAKKKGFFSGWWNGICVPVVFVMNLFRKNDIALMAAADARQPFWYMAGFVMGVVSILGSIFGGGSRSRYRSRS